MPTDIRTLNQAIVPQSDLEMDDLRDWLNNRIDDASDALGTAMDTRDPRAELALAWYLRALLDCEKACIGCEPKAVGELLDDLSADWGELLDAAPAPALIDAVKEIDGAMWTTIEADTVNEVVLDNSRDWLVVLIPPEDAEGGE